MNYLDPAQAEWALQDPTTPGEALAVIAQAHPGLRDRVVTHPNAYPQLVVWVAAQSTSAASAPTSPQPGTGRPYGQAGPQPYGPAAPQPYGGPAASQPYGPPAPQAFAPVPPSNGMAPQYPVQPAGPGQPYYGPGGYPAGPPVKRKRTGLVAGLAGGGAVVVVAVVAVLGLFVFHWFGGSSGPGPTLTKSQTEALLGSDFVRGLSGGTSVDGYSHETASASDFAGADIPQGCQAVVDLMTGADYWTSSSVSVIRFEKSTPPDSLISTSSACSEYDPESFKGVAVNKQGGGWWIPDKSDGSVTLVYGNVWLAVSGRATDSDDKNIALLKDFMAAVDAASK